MARVTKALVVATTLLLPAAAALAQGTDDARARTEQHIDALRTQLKITPAEQGAWDGFAAVMRENAVEISGKMNERTAAFGHMNALDDLKSYAEVSALHAQEAQRLVAPFATLYEALTPAQKAAADQMFHQSGPHHGPLHG